MGRNVIRHSMFSVRIQHRSVTIFTPAHLTTTISHGHINVNRSSNDDRQQAYRGCRIHLRLDLEEPTQVYSMLSRFLFPSTLLGHLIEFTRAAEVGLT